MESLNTIKEDESLLKGVISDRILKSSTNKNFKLLVDVDEILERYELTSPFSSLMISLIPYLEGAGFLVKLKDQGSLLISWKDPKEPTIEGVFLSALLAFEIASVLMTPSEKDRMVEEAVSRHVQENETDPFGFTALFSADRITEIAEATGFSFAQIERSLRVEFLKRRHRTALCREGIIVL